MINFLWIPINMHCLFTIYKFKPVLYLCNLTKNPILANVCNDRCVKTPALFTWKKKKIAYQLDNLKSHSCKANGIVLPGVFFIHHLLNIFVVGSLQYKAGISHMCVWMECSISTAKVRGTKGCELWGNSFIISVTALPSDNH